MRLTLIWIVVALAVLLVVAGVAAVFRRVSVSEGTATLKLPGGVEITGAGGAVILVLVGALLLLTAWSWNDDREMRQAAVDDLMEVFTNVPTEALKGRIHLSPRVYAELMNRFPDKEQAVRLASLVGAPDSVDHWEASGKDSVSTKGTVERRSLASVELNPTSKADLLFEIAVREYQAKHWEKAADGFRRVLREFPGYSAADEAQFLLADAYGKAGDKEQARLVYEHFLTHFPQSELRPTAQFQLGLQYFQNLDFMQAAVAFTQVLGDSATAEVMAASRYNLALCQRQLGQPEDARTTLLAYREKHPNDARAADVAYQLGDLLEAAGEKEKALEEFQTALASRPSNALEMELLYRVGLNQENQGNIETALKTYNRAILSPDKRNPFRLSALARSAAIFESRNELTRAMNAYRDIEQNSKDNELAAAAAGRANELQSARGKKR